MKDRLTDANFPRTADNRVYHLGLRPGEVANRIVTVGSPSRAQGLSKLLDAQPKPFILSSERGFLTITGRYRGVPVSIVSIGMGSPNMDFFVREVRECINGDMVVIRLGSCGALVDVPVGSVAVPNASLAITRNVDFDFANPGGNSEPAYKFSKQVPADLLLHSKLQAALEAARPSTWQGKIIAEAVNASADSFYSSQGRQTSFPDHNTELIHQLQSSVPNAATLEMETFHLFHLAACWSNVPVTHSATPPPLSAAPVKPTTISEPQAATAPATSVTAAANSSVIRAAAVQMIFANRTSRDFITPEQVAELEHWTGKAVFDTLYEFAIPEDKLHPERGSVWAVAPAERSD